MQTTKVALEAEQDIVQARQAGREMARTLGLGTADQTRLATAISELARNAMLYAGSGTVEIADESNDAEIVVRVQVVDHGPGIPDIEQAMAFGYSSRRGLGAGLPGTRRLVQDFEIESEPGLTRVQIRIRRRRNG